MKWTQTITGVLAIVGLGYLCGVGQSLVRQKPIILGVPNQIPNQAPTIQTPRADEPAFDPILDAPVPEGMITLRKAHKMWTDGAYFIDARSSNEYTLGHVSGAAHLNAETFFTKEGKQEMQTIPPDATVVVYCVGGLCDASENVKALLMQIGYTDLSVMGVGYDEWADAGFPVDLPDGAQATQSAPQSTPQSEDHP